MNIDKRDFETWKEETAPLVVGAEANGVKFTYP